MHRVRADVARRRAAVLDRPWSWVRQVHGNAVLVVDEPGAGAGTVADAAVTRHHAAALAVLTADCAPIALAGDGVVAVVHAGWRGLAAGVIDRAVERMGANGIVAALGPCIHPECYEFGEADLDVVADAVGDHVRAVTPGGAPALDLPAGVHASLSRAGVEVVYDADVCTSCAADDYFSYRARRETERQAVVAWLR